MLADRYVKRTAAAVLLATGHGLLRPVFDVVSKSVLKGFPLVFITGDTITFCWYHRRSSRVLR